MNRDKQALLSGVFWKFSERTGAQLVSLVVSVAIARLLSPSEYGIIPLVSVFITLSNVLVDSGFGMSLIQKKDADNIDFSTVLYFSLAFSSILYIVLFFVAVPIADFYKMPILTPVLRTLAVCIIIKAINSVQQAYVSRKMIFKKFFFATIIGTILSGVIGIALAYYGYGVWALVVQSLTNNILDTIILQLTIDWKPIKAFSLDRLKKLFNYGWKLLVQSIILQVYASLRSLVIGKIYTPADLAFYTKGNQFPDLISANVDTAINTALFPAMSKKQDSITNVKEMARKTTRIISYIMNPIMAGFIAVADTFVALILTDKWLPAVPYLRICCMVLLFRAPQTAIIQAVKAVGRSDTVLKMDIPVRFFAIIVLLISVRYGVMIFAMSEIIITIFGTVLDIEMAKKTLNYTAKEVMYDFGINTILSIIMGVVVFFVGRYLSLGTAVTLVIQVVCGVLIYILLSVLTKNSSYRYAIVTLREIRNKDQI